MRKKQLKSGQKKISIKYVLNDKVKPHYDVTGEAKYPVYIQVIYNQQNTKFPAFSFASFSERTYCTKEDFQKKFQNEDVTEAEFIESIIRSEVKGIEESAGNYSLKELSNRLEIYSQSVIDVILPIFDHSISKELGNWLTHNDYVRWEKEFDEIKFKGRKVKGLLFLALFRSSDKSFVFDDMMKVSDGLHIIIGWLIELMKYSIHYKEEKMTFYNLLIKSDSKKWTEFLKYHRTKYSLADLGQYYLNIEEAFLGLEFSDLPNTEDLILFSKFVLNRAKELLKEQS